MHIHLLAMYVLFKPQLWRRWKRRKEFKKKYFFRNCQIWVAKTLNIKKTSFKCDDLNLIVKRRLSGLVSQKEECKNAFSCLSAFSKAGPFRYFLCINYTLVSSYSLKLCPLFKQMRLRDLICYVLWEFLGWLPIYILEEEQYKFLPNLYYNLASVFIVFCIQKTNLCFVNVWLTI